MKTLSPPVILFIFTVLAVAAVALFLVTRNMEVSDLAAYFEKNGMLFKNAKDFIINDIKTVKIADIKVTKIEAKDSHALIQLELTKGLGEKRAKLYLEDKNANIQSMFQPQPAHYPGVITQNVECPQEFHPVKKQAGETDYYLLYANDRFTYGVCAPDLIKYRSVFLVKYCEKKDVFLEMRLFYLPELFDENNTTDFLRSLACA